MKSILRYSLLFTLISFLTLILFEFAYRIQIIDFYRTEIEALNPELKESTKGKTVMIFGDSFSAFNQGYVDKLSERYPKIKFINCSVSGIGIRQHALFFKKRIDAFKPDLIIYQFYVGNDLLDVQQDYNFSKGTLLKSFYYLVSDYFISLKYLNYKLSFLKATESNFKPTTTYSTSETYNPRIKKQFQINPNYLNETIGVTGNQKKKLDQWIEQFQALNSSTEVPIKLLVLPHPVQVDIDQYLKLKQIGAVIDEDAFMHSYNLIEQLRIRSKVQVFDPMPYFRDHRDDLYYSNDPHLNEFGHTVLAEFMEYNDVLNEH